MKITIVAVGKIKEKYLTAGIAEYTKRLGPYCRLEIIEVDEERMPADPSAAAKEKVLAREGERLLKHVRGGSYLIVLDVRGKALSSEELAEKIDALALTGQSDVTFVIGGAFGLSPAVLAAANERLSFSRMTFTHQMIRLLLVEQLYRAFKISRGEPYHW
ncbi:23S rRNA (pseudouridine(1915)-N(3))-methyltransferase RlmH [Sporolituus thermophilus]|uniref:Ribosomal RNA large subunit methyltransferase H n=1 Tax=Sporolituus thermophilus DSM 23256 TaxID=1123285 RepID=A0A1G7MW02_9FIRM|nr:23S rRNA (pseudouridine(1915)-N(3))-methyltransferase RlmH [Sporolituus thermophilus]SDF65841.1 23S rRNA (pseudouridine1915-N3)-methyltransferase [Sporolituus thermophilus DSM 23256]